MTDEEKKAYDNLIMLRYFTMEKEDKESIAIILNLINKQEKAIDRMAGSLYIADAFSEYGNSIEEIKEYFMEDKE